MPKLKARGGKPGIGSKNESGLHRALKFRYAGEGGATEYPVGGCVCDAWTAGGEAVEVQTGSFKPIEAKADTICARGRLRVVYPVVVTKYIELYDTAGKLLSRRKSPRSGGAMDVFRQLVYAPTLPARKKVSVELAFVDVVEKRVDDGAGSWRRRGVSITGRELLAWRESVVLSKPKDWRRFVPFKAGEAFTVKDMAAHHKVTASLARKCLYVLEKLLIVERAGKKGNAVVYLHR